MKTNSVNDQPVIPKSSYKNTYFHLDKTKMGGHVRVRYQNLCPSAQLTALSILLQDNRFDRLVGVYLDFKDEATANAFIARNKDLGTVETSEFGALSADQYASLVERPVSKELTYNFASTHFGYSLDARTPVKLWLEKIIAAIQDFDPLDKENFNELSEIFSLSVPNAHQEKIDLYKQRYFSGAGLRFFHQLHLPPQLVNDFNALLSDGDKRNIGTLSKLAHQDGMNEVKKVFKP